MTRRSNERESSSFALDCFILLSPRRNPFILLALIHPGHSHNPPNIRRIPRAVIYLIDTRHPRKKKIHWLFIHSIPAPLLFLCRRRPDPRQLHEVGLRWRGTAADDDDDLEDSGDYYFGLSYSYFSRSVWGKTNTIIIQELLHLGGEGDQLTVSGWRYNLY